MKKIYFAVAMASAIFGSLSAQVNSIITAPATNSANATTGVRAPNGTSGHTTMRGVFLVPSSELASLSSTVTSFGFVLNNGVNATAGGSLTVYLMNTNATSYTVGTNWTTATTGMTQVYSGIYNIPVVPTATTVDFAFPSNFNFTPGGALLVAYEYAGALFSTSPAVYTAYSVAGTTVGATNATTVAPASNTLGTTAFRPLFRFGTPNTYTNEVIVSNLVAAGITSTLAGTQQTITADIKNGSNQSLTNIPVALGITGANSFTNAVNIPLLTAGQSTTVAFGVYTPAANGISNMTVSVLPDQNNTNNAVVWTQSVTCDTWAANPPIGTYTNAIGFNTGSGIIASKFSVLNTSTLTAAKIAISTNSAAPGNAVYAALISSSGSILATSQTVTIAAGMLGTFVPFTFTAQPLTANTPYYIGLAQPSNTTSGYYPIGAQTTASAPQGYATTSLAGGTVTPIMQNLGFLGIEAVFAGACGPVGIAQNNTANTTITLYPNPTINGKTNISGLEGISSIAVYNMLGQVVLSQTTDKELVTIDLSSQTTGNYLVRITNSNNQVKTIKVINQ